MVDIVSSEEEQLKRLHDILCSYKLLYGRTFEFYKTRAKIEELYATEPYLESEKLTVVYMKMMKEKYDIPIITVRKNSKLYIIDGHHRCFSKWLLRGEYIVTYEIVNELFRPPSWTREILYIPMIKTGEHIEEDIKSWMRNFDILEHFRRIHNVNFRLIPMSVEIDQLIPTQYPQRIVKISTASNVPILVLNYKNNLYIIDGHTRAYYVYKNGFQKINALVLIPTKDIELGIVSYSKKLGIKSVKEFAKIIELMGK